jgi:DnaJ homolog subfamily C member 7
MAGALHPDGAWDDEIKPLKRSNSYDILEIDEDADENEIKKAFRKKALETHPDKTGGDDELFKKVREAYETIMKYFKPS